MSDTFMSINSQVFFIGNPRVGKSSLVRRLISNRFQEESYSHKNTLFATKQDFFDNNLIITTIMDLSGYRKFSEHVLKFSLKEANGVILVYDISSKESFEALNFWLDQINQIGQNNTKLILGNKCENIKARQVGFEEGLNLANKNNSIFCEVSAKTNHNVIEILESFIIKVGIDKKSQHLSI